MNYIKSSDCASELKGGETVVKVVLTVEQLAHLVCLPKQKQLNLLKEVTEGEHVLAWCEETHTWVCKPKE